MAKSGLKHIDVGPELSKTEWESEESHELLHGTSFPGSPVERQLFYRDDLHAWYIYNGSGWVDLQSAGGGGMEVHGNEYHDPAFASEADLAALITDLITPIAGEAVRIAPTADSPFTAKINGAPTSTSVVYDTDTGEGSVGGIYSGAGYWGRVILYNTTRSNSRKIVSVNTATNTITTEASTDDWANNDDITTHSPTVLNNYFVIDLSAQVGPDVTGVALLGYIIDTSGGDSPTRIVRWHPFTTYDAGKRFYIPCCLGNEGGVLYFIMPVYSQKIAMQFVSITSGLLIVTVKGVLK